MRRPRPFVAALGVMGALAVSGGAQACTPVTQTVAIVNGHRISQHELDQELEGFRSNAAFVSTYDQQQGSQGGAGVLSGDTVHPSYTQGFVAELILFDIRSWLIHAELVKRHAVPAASLASDTSTVAGASGQFGTNPSTGQPFFTGFNTSFQHLFEVRQAEQDALGKLVGAQAVDEAAIEKFYKDNQQDFVSNQCASHILVKTQQQAETLRAQIVAGASFAAVAKANSTDTATAAAGGSLGCDQPGQGTNPSEQDQTWLLASVTTPLNQVSQPVNTQLGWDLILVSKRTIAPLTETLKGAIQQRLQQLAAQPLSTFLTKLLASAHVTVSPAYGRWDPRQGTVVGPSAPDPTKSGLLTPGSITTPLNTGTGGAGGAGGAGGNPGLPSGGGGAPSGGTGSGSAGSGSGSTGGGSGSTGSGSTAGGGSATGSP